MKDAIVAEVRRHRMRHTERFHADLSLICADLLMVEARVGGRLVEPSPRRRRPLGQRSAP